MNNRVSLLILKHGCEYNPTTGFCGNVNGPLTYWFAPNSWANYGCWMNNPDNFVPPPPSPPSAPSIYEFSSITSPGCLADCITCPAGYSQISTAAECLDATNSFIALGLPYIWANYGTAPTYSHYLPGCHYSEVGGLRVRFIIMILMQMEITILGLKRIYVFHLLSEDA